MTPAIILSVTLGLAISLDYYLGEPANTYHPLVAFGKWVKYLEQGLLRLDISENYQRLFGVVAMILAIVPSFAWLLWQPQSPWVEIVFGTLTLYFCIGARSLQQHAQAVHIALQANDLSDARLQVSKIVSRQTAHMSDADIRRATIESVLENGADAVFAPLFWFVLLGPFGAVLYRLSNTLDAMWGYKTLRYRHFGWASARFDDAMNWLPARLTALSYTVLGNSSQALQAWRYHAPLLESPNAGPVMSAGAGALNLQLGGPAIYAGVPKQKPWFGGKNIPQNNDIDRACQLIYRTCWLWWLLIVVGVNFA
ncbi:adenosylcobinamide-phosphate synthase CbiB [Methylomonas sp. AM2-LC]|uniref:adenosylcobinamide-phosphate synthase CbiB n=1 Tax=Methylomonas sp. AM2-LC TaxID=3153301 RepID=UPI0032650F83